MSWPCTETDSVGRPEEVAANPDSYTGQYLAPILAAAPPRTKPRKRASRKK